MQERAKILLTNLLAEVHPADVFVCCASFESRSQSAPAQLEGGVCSRAHLWPTRTSPHVIKQSAKQLQHRFGGIARLVSLNTNNALRTADSLQKAIDDALKSTLNRFLVDITDFTHQSMLILLRIFHLPGITSIEFLIRPPRNTPSATRTIENGSPKASVKSAR